jgi:hypothetical protein
MDESDEFPEAFDRFEEQVDISRTRSFDELLMQFQIWAGRKWRETPRQLQALKIEARQRGIETPSARYPSRTYSRTYSHLHRTYSQRTYSRQVITRRGRPQYVYRDLKTGRFIRKR